MWSITPHTQNVYDTLDTHHFGVFPLKDLPNMSLLTAGLHIHYSDDKKPLYGKRTETIVQRNDAVFAEDIKKGRRIKGEYELKPWGFEYRSCPSNVNRKRLSQALFLFLDGSDL